MNAKIDPLGKLCIVTGWNFSFQVGSNLFVVDELEMIRHVQQMVGLSFKDPNGNRIGKVKDYSHIGGTSQFYLEVIIDDSYKDIMLAFLNPNKEISMGAK